MHVSWPIDSTSFVWSATTSSTAARDRSGGQQESRSAVVDAPPLPSSEFRASSSSSRLLRKVSRAGRNLSLHTKALLLTPQKEPHSKAVSAPHPTLPSSCTSCAKPGLRNWCSSVKFYTLGGKRSSLCGGSPKTTALPKASTTKWNSSAAKLTASATSKITESSSRYYVVDQLGFRGDPPLMA